jgi:hypothetical protein
LTLSKKFQETSDFTEKRAILSYLILDFFENKICNFTYSFDENGWEKPIA